MNIRTYYIKRVILVFLIIQYTAIGYLAAQNKIEVKSNKGLPSLFVNDQLYPPFAYMSYLGEKQHYQTMVNSGIHLFCIPAYLGDRGINANSGIGPFRSPIWVGNQQYDFSSIEGDFKKVVEADQNALIIVRFYLDAPLWWEKLNPDDATVMNDGSTFRQSFYSKKWQAETADALRDCIQWISSSPYAKNFVGVHVAAGSTEEWFFHKQQHEDKNPQRTARFREWMAKKYKNNKSLQKAWNDQTVTLQNCIPTDISLQQPVNRWRTPGKEQQIIDTFAFQSETIASSIAYFCEVVKKKSNGRLLTGAFYGYHYFLTDPRSGHGALSKLLECPYLDYLSSPNDYNRVEGEDWAPFAAIGSVQLHGKLWMAENDTRTHLTTLLKDKAPAIVPKGQYNSGVWIGPKKPETSLSLLWKNAGRMLAYGYGGWWFDMWGGWFDDPELLNVIGKTNTLYSNFPPSENNFPQTEVAVLVDEHLSYTDASLGKLTGDLLRNRYSLGKTGSPYDLFLRSDFNRISGKKYKFIWLLGVSTLSKKEIAQIKAWEKAGVTVMRTTDTGSLVSSESQKVDKTVWTSEELRTLFKKAGVHIYVDSDEVFYAGQGWIGIHTLSGGSRSIHLPFRAKVTDPVNSKIAISDTDVLTLTLEPNTTTILRIEPVK